MKSEYKVDINASYEWAREAENLGVTHRELEVLALKTEGYSNKEVAQILKIKHQSVKNAVHSLNRKLQVKANIQACIVALRLNMIKMRGRVQNMPGQRPVDVTIDSLVDVLNEYVLGRSWREREGVSEKDLHRFKVFLKEHGIDPDRW